ncbi:MAG: ABC transporter ATP-binding protein [Clostridia bacterium]|nr:ABC transporter ATP-binding protein [Clostridia bacterium]
MKKEKEQKQKQKKKKIDWKRTFKNNGYMLGLIIKACPGVPILALIATVLGSVHSFLLNTYLYQYALNALQEGKELKIILITLGCMFGYSVLYMLFESISSCYFELKYPKIEAYIQNLLQKKAVEVDLACFESSAFYDTYVKATSEATNRAYTVMNNILDVIWITINVVAVGTLIITIDPIFLILAFLPFFCTLLIGKKRNRLQYDYNMRYREVARQRDYVRRTFYLNDFSKEMRLTEMWKVMYKRMHASISEMKGIVNQFGYKLMFFRYLFDFVFDVVVYAGTIVLAAFKTLVAKNMLLGDCFVVINSISNVAGNVNYIGDVFFKLDENSLYVDNLRDFLEYEVHIAEDENAPVVPSFEKLELKNMTFRYEGQEKPALANVNLTVNVGEKIAIVGHNGAGKTTLVKLLQRLYDPSEGEILLNGENIKNWRLSSYRNLFGTVFQDYRLFATTVAENVMLRGDITDEDRATVKDALERAGVYGKIESLSNGVDSNVTREFDKEGAMFSGGEAQKISIARIFAGKQEIVIMDEPTSALDPIAEQEMYRNMFEACEGKTVIFISHRLSSVTMADRVYLFENGEIIEQGTHSELLAMNGKFADMWHKQADTYADAEEVTA